MRKFILTAFYLLSINSLMAQDIIILKNGDEIKSKVTKVGKMEIDYKKWSNLNGPDYTIEKSDVFLIKYQNGEKDIISDNNQKKQTSNSTTKLINEERQEYYFSLYNRAYSSSDIKNTGKNTKYVFYNFGINKKSELATNELEVTFNTDMDYKRTGGEDAVKGDKYINYMLGDTPINDFFMFKNAGIYQIVLKNVSNRILYVDLGNCFRIENNTNATSYYSPNSQTISNGNSAGAGIGLGCVASTLGIGGILGNLANGVSVGGQNSNGISTTYASERVLAIPPYSEKVLSEPKWIKIHGANLTSHGKYSNVGGHYEGPTPGMLNLSSPLKVGEKITYEEKNSPFKRRYIITYSKDPTFATYNTMNVELYLYHIIGCKAKHGSIDKIDKHTLGGIIRYNFYEM